MRMPVFVVAALAVYSCAPIACSEVLPPVGLTFNLPEGGREADYGPIVLEAKSLGVQFTCLMAQWSALEPRSGEYRLAELENGVRGLTSAGLRMCITVQTLDTNNRTLPADLRNEPFDSPVVRERFEALLNALAPKLTDAVRYVMLGNEADVYLAAHPNEIEAYAGFVERGREHLRTLRPGLPVGVTTTFNGLRDNPQIVGRINAAMDVFALTYYPIKSDFRVRPVSDIASDFDQMTQAAGQKPLVFQEIGYPADPRLGSSEDQQAAFVDAIFEAAQAHASQIGFFNFFLLHDFNGQAVEQLLDYYQLGDSNSRAFLSSLGLKRAYGTPRKAWARFQERLDGDPSSDNETPGTAGGDEPPFPARFAFHAISPNPFKQDTAISFDLPVTAWVTLAVFDAAGRQVRLLVDEETAAGNYRPLWDGTNDRGLRAGAGVYFCRLNAGSFRATERLIRVD